MKQPWVRQIAGGVGLLLGLFLFSYFSEDYINPYTVRILINVGIAMILALSLNLVNGCAGQFSLGHAGFMAVGAYMSSILTTHVGGSFFASSLGVVVATVAGGGVAAVAGYAVGLPSLRLRGDYLAIVTLGFGEIIRIVFLNMEFVGGARGLPGIPREANLFWVYTWVAFTFLCLYRFLNSSWGRAVLAIRENEIAAESVGVPIAQYKVLAFVLSSFFAGIAGALFAHSQGFIDPQSFNFTRSVEVVIMVVLGGMGSLSGAAIGAVVVTVLPELLRVFESYRLIVFPAILVVVMLLRPMGVFGHHEIWELLSRLRRRESHGRT